MQPGVVRLKTRALSRGCLQLPVEVRHLLAQGNELVAVERRLVVLVDQLRVRLLVRAVELLDARRLRTRLSYRNHHHHYQDTRSMVSD